MLVSTVLTDKGYRYADMVTVSLSSSCFMCLSFGEVFGSEKQ